MSPRLIPNYTLTPLGWQLLRDQQPPPPPPPPPVVRVTEHGLKWIDWQPKPFRP